MKEAAFDAMTRGLSRRTSIAALSAAGMVALASPLASEAKKKKRKKVKNKCLQQEQQCLDVATPLCEGDADCENTVEAGCQFAGLCEPLLALIIVQGALP